MNRVRKTNQMKQPSQDRWLVSYADYMTLMFALFVVLYASSIVKEQSFDVLSESLGKIFDISGDKGKGVSGNGLLTNQVSQTEHFDGNSLQQEKGPELIPQQELINESVNKQVGNPLEALKHELNTALYELTENGLAKLEQNEDWLTIELSSGLLFPSGSATTSPAAAIIIEELSKVLLTVDNIIEIRGYTDSLTINNELFRSNWQLSAARAASITNLLESFGVIQQRMTIQANGSNEPVASNETASGRAKNRRVVIALSKYTYKNSESNSQDDNAETRELLQQKLSDSINTKVPQSDGIRVIKMPNGSIKITTRQEEDGEVIDESID
ncbi:MAG: OmpA family protein [Gammaproteobacteria bacterium]|nr:OmpA family protein [Gammaproteobacteria bacterium]